ncbi:MAG: decaprenyl-phosphate phosphoribosyltransferase [Rhodothermia bacterium]|nr:decaprenyl-phosphate phosphoribosyltransferase [Rhodothermia bacterium]
MYFKPRPLRRSGVFYSFLVFPHFYATHTLQMTQKLPSLFRVLRPYHWIKNIVVWSAPIFALHFTIETVLRGSLVFLVFSLIASTFYVINDLKDAPHDQLHPTKKNRPIASGAVSRQQAQFLAGITGTLGIGLACFLPIQALLLVVGYIALQMAYNLHLKQEPILDLLTLALGFVLRALAGAFAMNVPVSKWFVLCLGLLSLFLGIEKRKAELLSLGSEANTRKVLAHYSLGWLHRMESIVSAAALMAYALWTIEAATSSYMLTTIPFVVYSLFRYQYLTENGLGETPEVTLFADRGMRYAFLSWLIFVLIFLALEKGLWA